MSGDSAYVIHAWRRIVNSIIGGMPLPPFFLISGTDSIHMHLGIGGDVPCSVALSLLGSHELLVEVTCSC